MACQTRFDPEPQAPRTCTTDTWAEGQLTAQTPPPVPKALVSGCSCGSPGARGTTALFSPATICPLLPSHSPAFHATVSIPGSVMLGSPTGSLQLKTPLGHGSVLATPLSFPSLAGTPSHLCFGRTRGVPDICPGSHPIRPGGHELTLTRVVGTSAPGSTCPAQHLRGCDRSPGQRLSILTLPDSSCQL